MESVRSHRTVTTSNGEEVYVEIIVWETGEVQLLLEDGSPCTDIDVYTLNLSALWGRLTPETEFKLITETPSQALKDDEEARARMRDTPPPTDEE